MKLMQEYALDRVCEGLTTIDEVLRVVPFEPIRTIACPACRRELTPAFLFCPYCGNKAAAIETGHHHALIEQGSVVS
jgi:Zn finger protein HypA/HybF involved in hydrogenase expression